MVGSPTEVSMQKNARIVSPWLQKIMVEFAFRTRMWPCVPKLYIPVWCYDETCVAKTHWYCDFSLRCERPVHCWLVPFRRGKFKTTHESGSPNVQHLRNFGRSRIHATTKFENQRPTTIATKNSTMVRDAILERQNLPLKAHHFRNIKFEGK